MNHLMTNTTQVDPAAGEFLGQRALDLLITGPALFLLMPFILLRAAWALLSCGRLLENSTPHPEGDDKARPHQFAGRGWGAGLAVLPGIVSGRLTLVEAPCGTSRPALFSDRGTRQKLGVDYLGRTGKDTDWGVRTYFSTLGKSLLAALFSPARPVAESGKFHLFGIPIRNARMNEVLDTLDQHLQGGCQAAVGFVNADCLNQSFTNDRYHETLKAFDHVYPDGIGVRLAAQMFGNGIRDNVNGTDLFPLLCERLAADGHSLFLVGARAGIAEQVAKNMRQRYPGLRIAGCHHGYFKPEEEDELVEQINRSGAKAVMVALGAPAQEMWIARHRDRLQARLLMGVGGLFDFYSGRIERAPVWLREVGLEWVWRLLQEPSRMWRRYVIGNPLFLYRAWSESRRNGSIARLTALPPGEENEVLGHFSRLDQGSALRPRLTKARQALWTLTETGGAAIKRLTDIAISSLMLFLLTPLFALVILSIRLESQGPVFYSQMRVGHRGREFRLWKFRSMYSDAENRLAKLETQNEMEGGVIFKMKVDPRVTHVGRIIRKTSIDELPQLWNVLKGEMSLVGPRPALASEVEKYTIEERVRLMAKPGLTCIWQVSGRSDIPFNRQVQLDEDYLYRQSVFADLKLLLLTIPAVIRGKGAY